MENFTINNSNAAVREVEMIPATFYLCQQVGTTNIYSVSGLVIQATSKCKKGLMTKMYLMQINNRCGGCQLTV